MVGTTSTPTEIATRLLANKSFHQCPWLPANTNHDKLRVTFATTTNFSNGNNLRIILFIGPMFGNRYFALAFDKIARENGVRVICVDRPGIGGSTPVPIEQRINVWLETVPRLLQHLNITEEGVSLVSHSAGTIYLLNTLYYLRDILHKERPYVAMLAPWVSQEHSNMALTNALAKLPNAAFDGWSSLAGFVNNSLGAASSWSGGVLTSAANLFQAQSGNSGSDDETSAQAKYGVDAATVKEIERLQGKYTWAESMKGANDEARLCLRGGKGLWGVCESFRDYVAIFCKEETARQDASERLPKLKLQVFFAESDMMIGKEGTAYFETCWNQSCVAGVVDVETQQLASTNHETIVLDYEKGAITKVFKHIGNT